MTNEEVTALDALEAQLTKNGDWSHRNGTELWFFVNGTCKIAKSLPDGGLIIAST